MANVQESLKVWTYYPNPQRLEQLARRREFVSQQSATLEAAVRIRELIARAYPAWQPVVEDVARGCVLVELELWDDGSWLQSEVHDVLQYNKFQNERAEQKGECDGGCDAAKLVETLSGLICRQTWKPCQARELAAIVAKINLLNPKQ